VLECLVELAMQQQNVGRIEVGEAVARIHNYRRLVVAHGVHVVARELMDDAAVDEEVGAFADLERLVDVLHGGGGVAHLQADYGPSLINWHQV